MMPYAEFLILIFLYTIDHVIIRRGRLKNRETCRDYLQPRTHVGENSPGLGRLHDTLNFGVFGTIICIGEIN